jgi:hypothetical protein
MKEDENEITSLMKKPKPKPKYQVYWNPWLTSKQTSSCVWGDARKKDNIGALKSSERTSLRSASGSRTAVYTPLINTVDEISAMCEHEWETRMQNCRLTVHPWRHRDMQPPSRGCELGYFRAERGKWQFRSVMQIFSIVHSLTFIPRRELFNGRWTKRIRTEGVMTSSVALVRERFIPTEWPPLVLEFTANFCGQRGGSPTAVFSICWTGAATFSFK